MNRCMKGMMFGLVCGVFISGLAIAAFPKVAVPDKGLVAYWAFDEGKGDESKDSSGKGHIANINGAEWAKGVVGSCLSFNGTDNSVQVDDAPDLSMDKALTIMMWIKANSEGSTEAFQTLISKWEGADRNYGLFLTINSGVLGFTTGFQGQDGKVELIAEVLNDYCFGS